MSLSAQKGKLPSAFALTLMHCCRLIQTLFTRFFMRQFIAKVIHQLVRAAHT